jgi:hypothetical protein
MTQNCMVQPDTRIYEEERNELHTLTPIKIDKENFYVSVKPKLCLKKKNKTIDLIMYCSGVTLFLY